ncbi:BMP family ABC transporter substrate-binding protein [Xylanimonas allomyrinae]|uniref:BMP family ABC transporter substrate-binding protein n=1 Tax=Xylanimonas allomyrinae TaxID=2509459 RepID=A0A4P6ET32_9MICO|nr:BMP family ABC transporter substrate-binding protein [Xylanimonas allomyrinae]
MRVSRAGRRSAATVALAAAVASGLATGLVSGCSPHAAADVARVAASHPSGAAPAPSAAPDRPAPGPSPRPLGAGFLGDTPTPAPESTVSPEPGSWDGVVPAAGYRMVLVTEGDDPATTTLAAAVTRYAAAHEVALTTLTAHGDDEVAARLEHAAADAPDLIVGAGDGVVDVFALLTAQHLDQQFLVLGAQLGEPTDNVTAVVWPGATFRGTGLATDGDRDPATVTAARGAEAIGAGVASVLHGVTGIVLDLR